MKEHMVAFGGPAHVCVGQNSVRLVLLACYVEVVLRVSGCQACGGYDGREYGDGELFCS